MTQHDDNASPWQLLHPVSDEQATAARLVIASAATHTPGTDASTCACAGCIADARLLMQACGLIPDPQTNRFIVMPNGHVKRGPNALRSGQTPSHSG